MKLKLKEFFLKEGALGAYVILIILISIMLSISPSFRTSYTFRNLFLRILPLFIIGLGETFVIIAGGIDISVGATMSLGNVIAASFIGEWSNFGIILALLSGAFVGLVNGIGVVKLKINPFLMTFCSMNILVGLSIWIRPYPGGYVSAEFANLIMYSIGNLPIGSICLFIVLLVTGSILLKFTNFGYSIYATGGNPESARLAGINVDNIKLLSFSLAGLLSSLAGVYFAARMLSGDAHLGDPFMIDAIMVATVGGASLSGGQGGVIGAIGGASVVAILDNAFNLLGFSTYLKLMVKGLILVGCILISNYQKNNLEKTLER
ncbi:Ribose import permease protein RbsC [subsurface metagenome]|jgi:ribose/xylose/arabinose/galactoside ABC-type transport system permease subunit